MQQWKKEIRQILTDFNISRETYKRIIRETEQELQTRKMPNYYKGNNDQFKYDTAQRKVKAVICM